MNIWKNERRIGIYYNLSNLSYEELKDVFFIASVILKERKRRKVFFDGYTDTDSII